MKQNIKLGFKILFLVSLLVTLNMISYSWFADRSNPTIEGSEIQVAASDGLVIKLEPDSAGRTLVNLKTILNDEEEFLLKQVSSADGVNFFTIDFGEGLSLSQPKFISVDPNLSMAEKGYIDYDFYLSTEDYAKHVYIHKDTSMTGEASDSIRIAITMTDETDNSTTIIFGDEAENGITDEYTTEAVIAVGAFEYGNISKDLISNQLVRTFSYSDGGRSLDDNEVIDLNKLLTTIPANTTIKMNVKIWLEGGDTDCNNTIASTYVDLLLKFGSANVLLDAPVLTGNSDYTITGLATNMEYSLTNTPTSEWITITDPNMTFDSSTVYVRIKEKVGVSSASYVTPVTFGS